MSKHSDVVSAPTTNQTGQAIETALDNAPAAEAQRKAAEADAMKAEQLAREAAQEQTDDPSKGKLPTTQEEAQQAMVLRAHEELVVHNQDRAAAAEALLDSFIPTQLRAGLKVIIGPANDEGGAAVSVQPLKRKDLRALTNKKGIELDRATLEYTDGLKDVNSQLAVKLQSHKAFTGKAPTFSKPNKNGHITVTAKWITVDPSLRLTAGVSAQEMMDRINSNPDHPMIKQLGRKLTLEDIPKYFGIAGENPSGGQFGFGDALNRQSSIEVTSAPAAPVANPTGATS